MINIVDFGALIKQSADADTLLYIAAPDYSYLKYTVSMHAEIY